MDEKEFFRTREGRFRILVEQVINGDAVDWHLVERRTIQTPNTLAAHTEAVRQFVGREVEYDRKMLDGYTFTVAKEAAEVDGE